MNVHDSQNMKDDVSFILLYLIPTMITSLPPPAIFCFYFLLQFLPYECVNLFMCSNSNYRLKVYANDLKSSNDLWQEPLLKIEINNPALLAGNWSQLCATCKVLLAFFRFSARNLITKNQHLAHTYCSCPPIIYFKSFCTHLYVAFSLDCQTSSCKTLFYMWSLCGTVWPSLSLGIQLHWQGTFGWIFGLHALEYEF